MIYFTLLNINLACSNLAISVLHVKCVPPSILKIYDVNNYLKNPFILYENQSYNCLLYTVLIIS